MTARIAVVVSLVALACASASSISACTYDWQIGSGDTSDGGTTRRETGASDPPDKSGDCGFACRCEGTDTCRFTCPNKTCTLTCLNVSDCSIDCPGGSCTLNCEGNAKCDMNCAGGTCTYNCKDNSECSGDCKNGFCSRKCDSECSVDCAGGICS